MIVAHRGGVLGLDDVPENTVEAFEAAIAVGVEMVEFDVRRTVEGELIVFHDETVGGVPVRSLRRDEIAARTGVRPALLAEVLDATADRIGVDVELKEDGYAEEVHRLVCKRFAPEDVVFTSFLDGVVRRVKEIDPASRTGLLVGVATTRHPVSTRMAELYPIRRAQACRADHLAPHFVLARLGVLARAWRAGLPCLVWTVNDPARIRAFLADQRVAGLITDRPREAKDLRERLPAPRPARPA